MPDKETARAAEDKIRDLEDKIAALQKKCSFLERVVNEIPANIYISDLKEGVIWCNRTNEETLGYTLEEIKEMGGLEYMYKIVHPDDHSVPDNSIDYYQHFNGAEYGGVFRAKHKNEKEYKWFVGWARAFQKDPEGKVKKILCVDVDMSPQMNTGEQLVQALRENLKLKNELLIRSLRKREVEILNLICKGMSTKAIAEKLYISTNTVSTHRKNIQQKLGTNNVADLVSLAKEAGLG